MFTGGNVTLMVADFDRAVSFYTGTLGVIDTGVERLANFHDPDQTPLYLFEMAHG